uniref:hypothetical protein n=1 Tax=Eubacterium sp. TaxID=142586 RepID=UPI003FEEA23F
MVAPTYTFLGFNYSMQNLPHHRTQFAYRLARQKLKLSSARTQAPKQSTGLFLFASQIALFEPRNYTTIKKTPFKNGVFFYGADDEARTRYLNLGKVAL